MKEEDPYSLSLEEVKKAYPYSYPKPSVGAIVWYKNKCIGRGYTKRSPGFHAEVYAIDSVQDKSKLKESTLYVTLMPCCHYGETPPCTDKIIQSGIKKVVVAFEDPNPKILQISKTILEKNNIEVIFSYPKDILKEIYKYSETFFTRFLKQDMFVTLKYAMTLDGKIADFKGESKWISNEQSRRVVHKMRANYDAILVGEGTVVKDNPRLTVRGLGDSHQPTRVILNFNRELNKELEVFSIQSPSIFVISHSFSEEYKSFIKNRGHIYIEVEKNLKKNRIEYILDILKNKYDIHSLFVEGGASVLGMFYEEKLFDKVIIFIGNLLLGDGFEGLSPFKSKQSKEIETAIYLKEISIKVVGENNVLYEGYRNRESYLFK